MKKKNSLQIIDKCFSEITSMTDEEFEKRDKNTKRCHKNLSHYNALIDNLFEEGQTSRAEIIIELIEEIKYLRKQVETIKKGE